MIGGYAGKFLEADLKNKSWKDIVFDENILKNYIGGRGLAAKILWDRLGKDWDKVDPLSEENILLILTGPMTGYFPGAKICISGKSPQNAGIIGSTVSGEFPIELKCAGYDGIIITGESDSPVYLFIKDNDFEIRNADHLWGMDVKETQRVLTKEVRSYLENRYPTFGKWKEPAMLYIGPAGESISPMAAVMQKWTHAAGYGGYGAIMGSKKIKAVVVKGTGPLPEVADIEKVRTLIDQLSKICYSADGLGIHGNRSWGTGWGIYHTGNELSAQPVRNWQEEWHNEKDLGINRFENRFWLKRYWGDFGCPVTCMKVSMVRDGPFEGAISDTPDYEMAAYLGTNLGINKPDEVVFMSSIVDDLGYDGISIGNLMGFLAELYQKGILTKDDLGGIDLVWGNTKAFSTLIRKIANREGLGDLLAEGIYVAAKELGNRIGIDLMPYAIQVKGSALGAQGVRSGINRLSISYACGVQPGDHCSTSTLPVIDFIGDLNWSFFDSAVICSPCAQGPQHQDLVWEFFRAITGLETSFEDWCKILGNRIIQIQRGALLLGGPRFKWDPEKDDDNPPRFYKALSLGPFASGKVDRDSFLKMRDLYYSEIGWDKRGIPKTETLIRLGLDDLDIHLQRLRDKIID